ncbi:MAG: type VI secretion lipoprotein TssJ [Smithellaceae bacterium]|nr:type VI secretion lipoprotein TssJ [Smithellaceae bacterium]
MFMKIHFHRLFISVCVILSIFILSSCAFFQSTDFPKDAPYIKDGINFHLRGDSRLNLYRGVPHALVLCAYQLADANAFHQLLEEKDGMARLLACNRFDPTVNYAKKMIVQPGQDIYGAMEKTEGSRQVAVIAGYYEFQKKQAVKMIPLPVNLMFFFKRTGPTDISLYLSGQEIQDMPDQKSEREQ